MDKPGAIWITGANAGIGKALALKFVKKKHQVIGSARRSELFENINGTLAEPEKLRFYKNDVSDSTMVSELASEIKAEFNVECLINNAGVTSFKPFMCPSS